MAKKNLESRLADAPPAVLQKIAGALGVTDKAGILALAKRDKEAMRIVEQLLGRSGMESEPGPTVTAGASARPRTRRKSGVEF